METISAPVIDPAPSAAANRWIGVGLSTVTLSRQAGIDAAIAALTGSDPKLLVCLRLSYPRSRGAARGHPQRRARNPADRPVDELTRYLDAQRGMRIAKPTVLAV